MPSTVEKFPNEPIIIQTMSPDYQLRLEMPKVYPSLREILDQQAEPVFWVVNISAVLQITVEDLLIGTEMVAQGEKALYRHPNIREVLYVSTNPMIQLAVEGVRSDSFGNLKVLIFENLETALRYAREQASLT
jgi:hypothetical protein